MRPHRPWARLERGLTPFSPLRAQIPFIHCGGSQRSKTLLAAEVGQFGRIIFLQSVKSRRAGSTPPCCAMPPGLRAVWNV
jgi:hypothetical protein